MPKILTLDRTLSDIDPKYKIKQHLGQYFLTILSLILKNFDFFSKF